MHTDDEPAKNQRIEFIPGWNDPPSEEELREVIERWKDVIEDKDDD